MGLTQRQLSERSKVGVVQICKYEKGKAHPSEKVLIKIAQGLELPDKYFVDFEKTQISDIDLHLIWDQVKNKNLSAENKSALYSFLKIMVQIN